MKASAALASMALATLPAAAQDFSFFESKIRPVLASSCYECHGAEKQKSGLRLDWREGLLNGGNRGPAIVPGDPDNSLLISAIAHTHAELKMPNGRESLSAATVGDFREWIRSGAPDPRDKPSTGSEADWPAAFALRKQWWCWQPLKSVEPPDIPGVNNPVDRFLIAEMQKHGLTPAAPANLDAIVRRLSFVLTGLPPDVAHFSHHSPDSHETDGKNADYEPLIDNLLASPRFGERWARHWMDWLRYAESHGSEGDPAIPYAWRYRDYLIRALNADVPYPQLVKEHIAGDLLPPRVSADGTINEAAIGPAHLRMVFHGFTPTDALDERVTFTDNQVDVVSKAFMGMTVSCARCHNHKFDAISQEDYYALYGIFANCRPATISATPPRSDADVRAKMSSLKEEIRSAIRKDWDASFATLPQRLEAWQPANDEQRKEADGNGHGPLAAWLRLRDVPPEKFSQAWDGVDKPAREWIKNWDAWQKAPQRVHWSGWNARETDLTWKGIGHGVQDRVQRSEFRLLPDGDAVIESRLPGAIASARLTGRDGAVVASQDFTSEGGRLWVRVAGNNSGVRYVVQNYPRSGLIFPRADINFATPRWIEWNLDYWKGESIHLEIWTSPDAPIETGNADHAGFTLMEVAYPRDALLTPPEPGVPVQYFIRGIAPPANRGELLKFYTKTLRTYALCGSALNEPPHFVNFFIRAGLLPNTLKELPTAAPLVEEYRRLEKSLTAPVRVPGVMEGGASDHPLFIRGDHKKPGPPVPRHFLSAIDPAPYNSPRSGRLELAYSLTSEGNPLASRVIVNRLWHHVFGRGLVATPDNFGKLGELPTHPELLDWLARQFQKDGGSIKKMLRLLVTSQAFMASAQPSPEAERVDPDNRFLSHWSLRRLEAEAIRDAMLGVSGQLDLTTGGPSVDGSTPRRSVYVKVVRNDLDPLLTAFDAPVPSSTRGRRDVTNVPAQALALMNAPLVRSWAASWADRVAKSETEPSARIRRMYREAFQRESSLEESQQCADHVREVSIQMAKAQSESSALHQRITALEKEQNSILEPVRKELMAQHRTSRVAADAVKPVLDWDFSSDPGKSPALQLHGGANTESGALVLDGNTGYAASPPLALRLRAKTLEAWVTLDTPDQSGGGVISVQDLEGNVFDAIVFAEKEPRQWLAGSNFFQRTQTVGGPPESDAAVRPVHVAITWSDDGTISLYRNGKSYGQPYKSSGPVTFESGKAQVLLGLRHGAAGGNRLLKGRIYRARLYDRALTEKEIAVTAALDGVPIARETILAALTSDSRARFDLLTHELAEARANLAALSPGDSPPVDPWHSLALALINMKEFIYLR